MKRANLASLRGWALKAAMDIFDKRGWSLVERAKSTLHMTKIPSREVEHTLLITEPIDLEELRGRTAIALTSQVLIAFRDLERFIETTLGRDPDKAGYSVGVPLFSYAPSAHRYTVVEGPGVGGKPLEEDVKRLVEYHDLYIEPIRTTLERVDIFRDDGYMPPKCSYWVWNIRRAAYHQLYSEESVRRKCFAHLREQARSRVGTATTGEIQERMFHDVPTMLATAELRSAKELMNLIDAFERIPVQ